ncbi:MAG: hypothetical protein PF549_01425 [Patescibacteria group bacterium]|jgi:hypothetical protein|nr:hypothetical protein [Patescibacteria group bacterium]
MNENDEIRWSPQVADAHILTATGNPYGNPPDVGAYLRYAFKRRGLQEVCQRGTEKELKSLHILLLAKAMDGTLSKASPAMMSLFSFSAMKIAERLSKLSGQDWVALEAEPREKAAA